VAGNSRSEAAAFALAKTPIGRLAFPGAAIPLNRAAENGPKKQKPGRILPGALSYKDSIARVSNFSFCSRTAPTNKPEKPYEKQNYGLDNNAEKASGRAF
jgi:hypothetical protein